MPFGQRVAGGLISATSGFTSKMLMDRRNRCTMVTQP
jgi:hypothetical protein